MERDLASAAPGFRVRWSYAPTNGARAPPLYLAPTGLVLATLAMLDMKYSKWLKFVWPLVCSSSSSAASS